MRAVSNAMQCGVDAAGQLNSLLELPGIVETVMVVAG
jgi:hypothetical protein